MKARRGVSEVIAVLLLIVIVLGVTIIVVVFATGVIANLESGGVSTPVTAGGQMVVPGSRAGFAMVTLSLRNSDNKQVDAVAVACPASSVATNCPSLAMTYSGNLVSPATPLPLESTAVASGALQAGTGQYFVAGETYTFLLTLTFAGGPQQQTIDVEVTAIS
ncbi:MAG: hypothetical protein JRN09_05195 [Nitrososphaerota archaeon]|nr:hypothetical protein [Nitrososphaerota archaeon]